MSQTTVKKEAPVPSSERDLIIQFLTRRAEAHQRRIAELEARLVRAREALGHLDRARRVSERDQRPVPHWVIVEVCGVLSSLADTDPDPAGRATELDAEREGARILDQNAIRLLRERAEAAEARLVRAREVLEDLRKRPVIFPEDWEAAIRALADDEKEKKP